MILVKSQHNLTQNHIAKEVSCSNTELVCIGEMMYNQIHSTVTDLAKFLGISTSVPFIRAA